MSARALGAAAADAAVRPDQDLRRCLGHFATGVTIVSYRGADGPAGLTVNSFTSVSLDPPLVLVCLQRRSRAVEPLRRQPFAVSMLRADQRDLAWHFAGRPVAGLDPGWAEAGGVPAPADRLAWLACDPWAMHEAGDHVIVIGRVRDFAAGPDDPLCFFRGQFMELAS